MILTGKAYQQFKEWLLNCEKYQLDNFNIDCEENDMLRIGKVYLSKLPQSFTNALIIEWFETLGIIIGYQIWDLNGIKIYYFIDNLKGRHVGPDFKTINEALSKGIKLGNKLFNKGRFNDISTDNIKV